MLNVGQINEGYVIDHIKAGMSFTLYKYLKQVDNVYNREKSKVENMAKKVFCCLLV